MRRSAGQVGPPARDRSNPALPECGGTVDPATTPARCEGRTRREAQATFSQSPVDLDPQVMFLGSPFRAARALIEGDGGVVDQADSGARARVIGHAGMTRKRAPAA